MYRGMLWNWRLEEQVEELCRGAKMRLMAHFYMCEDDVDICFFFSSRRRHTRFDCDWSSDVCSSDLCSGGGDTKAGVVHEQVNSTLQSDQFIYSSLDRFIAGHVEPQHPERSLARLHSEIGRASCRERV